MRQGYVYCLSNKAHPTIYKIGYTTNTLNERIQSLNTTGVVYPFEVELSKYVNDCVACEAILHKMLYEYRA